MNNMSVRSLVLLSLVGFIAVVLIILAFSSFKVIEPGHAGVADLFGKVQDQHYEPGLHFVNPLLSWTDYDCRMQTIKERIEVPSQDQLLTSVEVSVQWRLNESLTPQIKEETGTFEDMQRVHLIPKVRSLLREQGKRIEKAEEFFKDEIQDILQTKMEEGLSEFLSPKGMLVDAVLIRDVRLPPKIVSAIESKKEREQEAERQKVELERFKTEQQQTVEKAKAAKEAAEQEKLQREILADARAYEIEALNKAIEDNPAYLQLQALEALKEISNSPSAKIYFIDSDSPQPLPLMHMGDELNPSRPSEEQRRRQSIGAVIDQ